ncbi:MAG: hypothetical protein RLZZ214_1770 [Verrucomicrobiota bacterium]|jgi:hypothetical protein
MRYLFLIALCFPLLATAQNKPQKRTCRILYLNPPPNAPTKLFLFDGTASQEVELPEMNFSDVYQIAGGDTNVHLLPGAVLKPEEIPAGAPAGRLPAVITDFYIVVSGDPANKVVPVQFQIIDAGSEKFKRGQMMWYNLTGNAVGGQLGSQKLAIKGQSRAIIDSPAKGEEDFDVNLSYVIQGDPQFHPICQTKWVHDPRSRMVMFVYGGAQNTTPQIAGFKDFRSAPEKTE